MADWYVGSVQYAAVAQWAASTAYSVGNIVRQLAAPTAGNERCFRCTTAGTSGGTEPAWSLTKGTTTASGTATFTEVTGNSTYNWSAPHARIASVLGNGATNWPADGDRVFVAHNHAETQSGTLTIPTGSGPGSVYVYCVSASGSVPPVSADLATTATVTVTAGEIRINTTQNGLTYFRGIQFSASTAMRLNSAGGHSLLRFKKCKFSLSSFMFIGAANTTGPSYVEFDDTQYVASNANSSIYVSGEFVWKNTSTPLGGGTVPTVLFDRTSADNSIGNTNVLIKGLDLSALNTTLFNNINAANGNIRYTALNCKLHASVTTVSTISSRYGQEYNLIGCDSSGDTSRNEKHGFAGKLTTEKTIIRTGGASDGVTGVSWKVVTPTTNTFARAKPFESMPISAWNATTGSSVTATVEIVNDGTTLKDDEVYIEVEYLSDASSPVSSMVSSAPADHLASGSNLSTSSATWTTTGLASPVKQKMSVSFTPQQAGLVRATVKCAKTNQTLYVDPVLTLS